MDTNLRFNPKGDQRLDCIRRRLRRHDTTSERQSMTTTTDDDTNGLFLEMFCFNSSEMRQRIFWRSVKIGETFCARIVSSLDTNSFSLRLIQNRFQYLEDLRLNGSVTLTTDHDLDVNDVVRVRVRNVRREERRVTCELTANECAFRTTDFGNTCFEEWVKSDNRFGNPFLLRRKRFSSLLVSPRVEERRPEERRSVEQSVGENVKRKRRQKSSSSSSTTTTTTSTTSSSSETTSSDDHNKRQRKRRHKKREKSHKISFVVKSSRRSRAPHTDIPGLGGGECGGRECRLSERVRRQMTRDEEIERKIHLLAKTVQKSE